MWRGGEGGKKRNGGEKTERRKGKERQEKENEEGPLSPRCLADHIPV